MVIFHHTHLTILPLYNEITEKRNFTYWRLIYKNIEKLFNKNFEYIKYSLSKD